MAVGYDALLYAEEGSWNTAIGTFALENTLPAAFANTALGYGAGRGNATGYSNSSSTWVGYQSGYNIRTGSKNITLGYKTADSLTTGSGNIVIGYDIDTPAANSDNTLTIGNIIFANGLGNTGTTVATGTVGVGIAAPTAKFHISRSTGGIEKLFQVGTTTTTDIFSVNSNGRVGVGTSTPWEAMEFAVAGDIVVTGNVYKSATAYVNPDYVFAKYFNNPYNEIIPDDYQMLSLDDLGLYIQEHNHLPGVEMKSGVVDIFEANRLNLEKIEELSLYILEINNRIKVFEEQGGEEEIEMAQDYQYSKLTVRDKAIFEGDIIVEDHIYFNKDAVGQAKILVGATEVEIRFDKGYEYSPIVTATPNEFIEGQYKITEKTNDGFKIVLEKKQFLDIVFDWHAFASPEAKLFVSDGSVEEIQLSVSNEQLIIEASQEQVSEASSEQPATELEAVEGSITQEITAEEPAAEPPPADGQVAGEATEAGPDEEITSTEGDDHPAIEAEMLNESFDESTEIEAVPTE
ncbi:hypothetical protein GYA13_01365 [Candidatus Kuenenbacteria bacterium]|nr:hypothetical protein [Candidatus Kuenenbacteria bacterium]